MNLRFTYILFGLFVAVLLVVAGVQLLGPSSEKDSEWALPELHKKGDEIKSSEIDTLIIERHSPKEETLVFTRGSEGWEMQKPHQLRVDNFAVQRVVDQIVGARREKSEMSTDLAFYKLESPAQVVTLRKGDQQWQLKLGKQSSESSTAVAYILDSARPKQPMAVKKSDLDSLHRSVNEFRSHELLGGSSTDAVALTLAAPKQDPVVLQKGTDSKAWHFEKPPYGAADFEGEPSPTGAGGDPLARPVTGVRKLLDDAGAIRVENEADFVAEDVSDADLADKYGLKTGEPETLRIEMKRTPRALAKTDGENTQPKTDVLLIGKKVEEKKEEKKDDKKPEDKKLEVTTEYYYARLENEKNVVKVPVKKVEPMLQFLKNPGELRDKNLVHLISDSVDAIDLKNESGVLKLRRDPSRVWKLYRGDNVQPADGPTVQRLIDEINSKASAGVKIFPDPNAKEADLGLDKPDLPYLALWQDGIAKDDKKDEKKDDKKEEKKDDKGDKKDDKKEGEAKKPEESTPKLKSDKPTVKIVFGKRDRDKGLVYVRRETSDGSSVVAISDAWVDKVGVGPLAFLDRKIPSFGEDMPGLPPGFGDPAKGVKELVLTRGGSATRLEQVKKEGAAAEWKFQEPESLKDRPASASGVTGILTALKGLSALKLVVEKPTDADLELYGLKTPQVEAKVVVEGKDNKTDEFVYKFGKETEDKTGVFAMTNKRDIVFVTDKAILDRFKAELRDLTVLHFEPSKLKSLKLTGWVRNNKTDEVELERKAGGIWTYLVPPELKVDSGRAQSFVDSIRDLQATSFVPKDSVKPEVARLDPKDGALLIEITLDGEMKPLQLTIGGLDAENKHFFARSSQQGDDLFLLPREKFDAVKGDAEYFRQK
jgi:hypothetical protein